MYPIQPQLEVLREVPDNGPGTFFELYSATYKYTPKKDNFLDKQARSKIAIIGLVPDKYVPVEGGTFKMYHHKVGTIENYGAIKLDNCKNVVNEEGSYYFESDSGDGKYIIVPWDQSN